MAKAPDEKKGDGGRSLAARTRKVDDEQRLTDTRQPPGPGRLLKLSGPIVGIDLGTVNSCVAICVDGEAEIIAVPGGGSTVPSVVYWTGVGDLVVGHAARNKMLLSPDRGIYASKRFLGRPFASKEVNALGHFYHYDMVPGGDARVAAKVGERVFRLEEVAAAILAVLKKAASDHLGQNVQRAVVTVPAYFGETQREAVRDAGRLAGLHVERILNEPTAAAVAYGAGRGLRRRILVYDLGGGTFDASILRVDGDRLEVLATDGDPFLGGSDFDDRLTEWLLMSFERETDVNLRDQPVAVQRIRFCAEEAKIELSTALNARVHIPYITQTEAGPVVLDIEITRERFDELTQDLVERTLGIVQGVLDRAKISSKDLDDVILVGGQSRSPMVTKLLSERFGHRPCKNIHPDEAVALGAARVAELLDSAAPLELIDVLAAAIRLGTRGGGTTVLLAKGIKLPAEKRFTVPLSDDPQKITRLVLYRGEDERAEENTPLGFLKLPGVAPLPGQKSKAKVTIRISSDGLMSVVAEHPDLPRLGELQVIL